MANGKYIMSIKPIINILKILKLIITYLQIRFPDALHIFGDYVVTYTGVTIGKINEDITIFVIHSKNLAESYRTWFWYMWEQSTEDKKK